MNLEANPLFEATPPGHTSPRVRRLRLVGTIILIVLAVVMVGLFFVETWLFFTADVAAFGSIKANDLGLPGPEERGAFLLLNDKHSPQYEGNLLKLLATTQPGVVDETQGAHLLPGDIKAVLVQTAQLGNNTDYRVYRIAEDSSDQKPMGYAVLPGEKDIAIMPKNNTWEPGAYLIDIPEEGMFGGRTYFQFYVDPPE